MLRHIVLVKFKPETGRAAVEKIIGGLRALPSRIAEIRSYEVGEDILHTPRSFDLAIVGTYDDVEALKRYQAHPEHVPVLEGLKAHAAQIVSVDYKA